MKFVRYSINNSIKYGLVEGNPIQENENFHGAVVKEISSAPWDNYKISNIQHKIEDIKILAPCDPKIVFFMGGNFKPSDPEIPQVYTKTSNSIIGPNDTIVIPKECAPGLGAENIQQEAELVAIIGKTCRRVSVEDALDYVGGYTCGNDVSVRDWQHGSDLVPADPTFWRAKATDTFSPIRPYIETDLDPNDVELFARVSGKEFQHNTTKDIVHDTAACISYISQWVSLQPGDVIFTGTGDQLTDPIRDGDLVEIDLPKIGILRNPVVLEK